MKPSPRVRRWLVVAGVLFVVFSLVGFFVLPPIIKSQAEKRLSAELGRTVTIGKVRVNPYVMSVTLENFDLQEKDGRGSFLGWSRLYVNFDALSSLTGDWVLGEIELDGFHVAPGIKPDGTFNFADLLARFSKAGPAKDAKPGRALRVSSLKVNGGRVEFSDASRKSPFTTTVGPLTFTLVEFRTAGSLAAPYRFEAVTEAGEKISWSGTLVAEPLASRGEFEITNLILKKYTPYFEEKIQSDLADGKLSLKGRYELNLDPKQRSMKMTDGEVHLRDFKVNERATRQPAVELSALDVTGIQADAIAMKAVIGRVAIGQGRVVVRREQDGAINLLTMIQPVPVASIALPAASASPAPSAKLPDVSVGEVAVSGLKLEIADNAAPRPAALAVDKFQASLKNVTLAEGATIPIDVSLEWAPKGTVHVAGTVKLKPQFSADLKADVTAVDLLPLSPYLEQFVDARITQGAVTTSSMVQFSLPADGAPSITMSGDVSMQKLGLVDGAHNEELAGFGEVRLSGLKVSTASQLSVSLTEIAIVAPYARVTVNADKSINLLAVMKPSPPAASPSVARARPKVEIGRVMLSDGDFSFTDRSVEPNVRTAIGQFGGTISGLSSENMARADVDLKGTVDGAGPVAITGKLDPLGARKFVDLKVDFKNVDLLPASPYTGKFAGYELARGKLFVDSKVLLEGKKLNTSNVVTLTQFTFGSATNSPEATGLPVRLGVALLKDIDGKIVIDLPVQGSLDDPNFRIGKVVMRVIVNLLTKAATSPFSLLGSMFGGGGDELAFQEFQPGSSEIQASERPKLETMVKALANRPGLSLGLEGSFDAAADAYALKHQKLADLVRRQIWEAKHASDPNIAPPGELVVAPEERAAMVKKLFDEKFPPGTQFGAPIAAAPVVVAPPAPPKVGFIRRILNALGFRKKTAVASAPREKAPDATVAVAGPVGAGGASMEEMEGRLADTMTVDTNDLRGLTAARAQRVRDYFINEGKIAGDRLFLAQGKEAEKNPKGPRVFLSLQ